MPTFIHDQDVDKLDPAGSREDLVQLLSLLCGQDLSIPTDRRQTSDVAREAVLAEVLGDHEKHVCPSLSYEQLNELLLLYSQDRVSEWFFRFFFLGHSLSAPEDERGRAQITPEELKKGVVRFRGYALLCFGNFRFAFKQFSEVKGPQELKEMLGRWGRESAELRAQFEARPTPIVSIAEGGTRIPRDRTWQVGYLSRIRYFQDVGKFHLLDAAAGGESPDERLRKIKGKEIREAFQDYRASWERLPDTEVKRWSERLSDLKTKMREIGEQIHATQERGAQNTVKYLTWDFLDIYVATSMREPWQFADVSEAIERIWRAGDASLEKLGVRWFDPTQSDEPGVIDKGLVEALMLKRADATVYMVQEGETLGKDSELAATLAQGKPVVAYVPQYDSSAELKTLAEELAERPIEYFRKRLRGLQAEDFFGKGDNMQRVIARLGSIEGSELDLEELDSRVKSAQVLEEQFDPLFKLISSEADEFRGEHGGEIAAVARLFAALESVEADNRAGVLMARHPLAFQVHLESGVANGVLVARGPEVCAEVLCRLLLNELEFGIEVLEGPEAEDGASGARLATVLVERSTQSRFRVVTEHKVLTNSFWNFYGPHP